MNKGTAHTLRQLCRLLPMVAAFCLWSCTEDSTVDFPEAEKVGLKLQITADRQGNLPARADDLAGSGEFMNSLCVLIVDSKDKVEYKLTLSAEELGNAAAEGNLETYISPEIELRAGRKTIYAFSNWSTANDPTLNAIVTKGQGEPLSPALVSGIVLDNPADRIDLTAPNAVDRRYIPMSAKREIMVTPNTTLLSIGLDRVVSKVRISVNKGDATATPSWNLLSLTFEGYADRVPLLKEGTLSQVQFDQSVHFDFAPGQVSAGTLPDFFVNETPAGHPFTLRLTTDEKGGTVYTAQTARNDLPRNHIFPLALRLQDYLPKLQAQCWVSPIGSLPVEVQPTLDEHLYQVVVPEGCQFALTVAGVTGGTAVSDLTCHWAVKTHVEGITFDGDTNGTTLKGHVAAVAGKTYGLTLEVGWKDGEATYNRTYTLQLLTKDLSDFEWMQQHAVSRNLLPSATLNLIKN